MEKEINLTLIETVEMMRELADTMTIINRQKRGSVFPYSAIVSIMNGGFRLGSFLSEKFWVNDHLQIKIQYRDENRKIMSRPRTKGIREVLKIKTPILLVDDIVDSGTTIEHFQRASGYVMGEDFDLAVLHWCKELSPNVKPTFYQTIKSPDEWIVYPWERPLAFDEVWELALL